MEKPLPAKVSFKNKKSLQSMQAVERAHFFAEPVLVPIVDRKNLFGLTGSATAQKCEKEFGRFTPQATEFMGTTCHN